MRHAENLPLVTTVKERCRVCYTCVRECPAKAIRIADGQAEVIPQRCIGCGNCVRVCSQRAKQVLDSTVAVDQLLKEPGRVAAIIAPSFPAEFASVDPMRVVGMIRALGFDLVNEVAFGADLVADRYRQLLEEHPEERFIATSCPAIFGYVERYHPEVVSSLAPIVSPMIATARVLHRLHGKELRIVFIGPCIAKKGEAASVRVGGEVNAVLTFVELQDMLRKAGLKPDKVEPSEFDPPLGGPGALFPISRGMLQAAGISENLMTGQVVAADGRTNFVEAISEFKSGDLDARLLEVLCCNGCIMGAGTSSTDALFRRRSRVSQYVRRRQEHFDTDGWRRAMDDMADLDLSRVFAPNDQRMPAPLDDDDIRMILARMGKFTAQDELNCGACGYDTCREHAIAIFKGLAESEMCLPYTIEQLRRAVKDLAVSNDQLASAQAALIQSEKLASMGQLAAGIAHEVNNPLGVVLMYAHLLLDECPQDGKLRGDLKMVAEQADRCKKIVAGLLHFARQNKVVHEPTDLVELVDKMLAAVAIPDNVQVRVNHQLSDPVVDLDRDQMVQVLTNLVTNAVAAMPQGGTLTVATGLQGDRVQIDVTDTGVGIKRENMEKIFEPFFTTKQIGEGTGLGLAVTYGIVKMHRGDIRVQSNADPQAGPTGTTFTVTLPRRAEAKAARV
ncbi:MAG: 4Fe-4S binding protein [Planctomycetes bacterium]|nr:4Fe-4S binding protein [Planctomycetota bacterium]